MKTYCFLMLTALLLTFRTGNAQSVPRDVTNSFNTKYPAAKNIIWKHQLNDFRATFVAEDHKYEARFNNNGDWKITQKEITLSAFPDIVKSNLLKSSYAGWNISSAYILYFPYVKPKYHIIVVKNDTTSKSLLFTENGKLRKNNFTL